MKYLSLLFLVLIMSCSEEDAPKKTPELECRLTKIVVTGANTTTQTAYTYNSSGKMDKQVRTRNGAIVFDYTYTYNSAGKIDKVDMVDNYIQYEYGADGKIGSITTYSKTGAVIGKNIYTWSGSNVEIKFTQTGMPNTTQVTALEFLNDNLVKRSYKIFTGNQPNVLSYESETRFEEFDTALSAFYLASSTRPGFTAEISKNNPRKQVETSISYSGGTTQESATTTTFSYTYNASNATLTSKATTGTDVVDTMITYDQCN